MITTVYLRLMLPKKHLKMMHFMAEEVLNLIVKSNLKMMGMVIVLLMSYEWDLASLVYSGVFMIKP